MADSKKNDRPGAGRNGNVPPAHRRWPQGQSGNPAGTTSVGKSAKQWANDLDSQCASKAMLRAIIADDAEPPTKRAAALRMLRMMESPDLADFEPYLKGTQTLEQLKVSGVDTTVVKKAKERQEVNKDGVVVAVTRELELFDRSGEEFDRICDRTEGKPAQALDVSGMALPSAVQILTPLTRAAARGST